MAEVLRYAAFSDRPDGGNPAGVMLDAAGLDDRSMQAIASEVGYSETAFLIPDPKNPADGRGYRIRYFSPRAEVTFCGHATIATAVALAERLGGGVLYFATAAGPVPVETGRLDGRWTATLTSVPAHAEDVDPADLQESLAALGWAAGDLDPLLPPRVGFAGNRHLVLAARSRKRLAQLEYDFDRLLRRMSERGWTTVHLVWRDRDDFYHARNPFPVGGVVEDPATGAAAAAFGAYLREIRGLPASGKFVILQGEDMGRPSWLDVEVREGDPRIRVSGTAVSLGDGGQS